MNSFGASTLTTSAPSQASRVAANGPTPPTPKSATRTPASGRAGSALELAATRVRCRRGSSRKGRPCAPRLSKAESPGLRMIEALLERLELDGRAAVSADQRDRFVGGERREPLLVDRARDIDVVTPTDGFTPAILQLADPRSVDAELLHESAPCLLRAGREVERDPTVSCLVARVDEAVAGADVGSHPLVGASASRPDDRLQGEQGAER